MLHITRCKQSLGAQRALTSRASAGASAGSALAASLAGALAAWALQMCNASDCNRAHSPCWLEKAKARKKTTYLTSKACLAQCAGGPQVFLQPRSCPHPPACKSVMGQSNRVLLARRLLFKKSLSNLRERLCEVCGQCWQLHWAFHDK